jgi:hypothetical protein
MIIKIVLVTLFLSLMSLFLISCDYNPGDRGKVDSSDAIVEPIDYGSGVYYFQANGYPRNLSAFKASHPQLEYIDSVLCPNPSTNNGYLGYYVNFKYRN